MNVEDFYEHLTGQPSIGLNIEDNDQLIIEYLCKFKKEW
jgi:hypothetical protein